MPLYVKDGGLIVDGGALGVASTCCCNPGDLGACCLDNDCVVTDQAACLDAGGDWKGVGTECDCAPGGCIDICGKVCPGDPCGSCDGPSGWGTGAGGTGSFPGCDNINGFGLNF